jgi:hypothetical protein
MRIFQIFHRISFFPLVIALISACTTTDSRLTGKWRSNLELTTEYNEKHAKLSEGQRKVFSQMFGKMEVDYSTPGKCEVFLPRNRIHTDEKDIETDEFKEICEYKIIYRNQRSIVIVYNDPLQGEMVRTINFVHEDTYWIYLGGNGFLDLNMREYFTRIK